MLLNSAAALGGGLSLLGLATVSDSRVPALCLLAMCNASVGFASGGFLKVALLGPLPERELLLVGLVGLNCAGLFAAPLAARFFPMGRPESAGWSLGFCAAGAAMLAVSQG